MSNETVGIIKKHISDTLGVELMPIGNKRENGVAFKALIDGGIARIFISEAFVFAIKESDDMNRDLEQFDILSFINRNPGCNIFIGLNGLTIDSADM